MVLEKVVLLSDAFGDPNKLAPLVKWLTTGIQQNIVLARNDPRRSGPSLISDCAFTYMTLLQALLSAESTKTTMIALSQGLNQVVLEAKTLWEDNQQLSKLINGVLFVLAKQSNDQAEHIVKRLVIKEAIDKMADTPTPAPTQTKNKILQQETMLTQ